MTSSVEEQLAASVFGRWSASRRWIVTVTGLIESSTGAGVDDEHDPEGATIAFERAQLEASPDQSRRHLSELDRSLRQLEEGAYWRREAAAKPIAPGTPGRPAHRQHLHHLRRPRLTSSHVPLIYGSPSGELGGRPWWHVPILFPPPPSPRAPRTALLCSGATGLLYAWGLGASGWANSFYSAAVQAGSHSWKAFFFGSSDAANFITVDKTPLALWPMDVVARVFGVNAWSILLPQALMGVATVALLYAAGGGRCRAVSRAPQAGVSWPGHAWRRRRWRR